MPIDVGCFDNVDFQSAEPRKDGVELVCIGYPVGKRLVQVVKREIALLLGQLD